MGDASDPRLMGEAAKPKSRWQLNIGVSMCGGWWATADLLETLGRISKREGVTFRSLCHPSEPLERGSGGET